MDILVARVFPGKKLEIDIVFDNKAAYPCFPSLYQLNYN